MVDRVAIEGALATRPSAEVAHYTAIGTLTNFMSPKSAGWISARATPIQFLNDRQELELGLEVLQGVANRISALSSTVHSAIADLRTGYGSLDTDVFQMSFSGDPDELGQLRGYGRNGFGCAVVTSSAEVARVSDASGWVLYDTDQQEAFAERILTGLPSITRTNRKDIQQTIAAASSFIKHYKFSPEQEYRLLKFPLTDQIEFRETGDRLVPFVDFLAQSKHTIRVDKIILGPAWQLSRLTTSEWERHHVVQGLYRLLVGCGSPHTAIVASEIPYDPR